MASDIERYSGGDLAPVPAGGGLAPTVSGDRMPQVDYINGRAVSPQQQRQVQGTPATSWFGTNIAGHGITVEALEGEIDKLAAVFTMDALKLGHKQKYINSTLAWVHANWENPIPSSVPVQHNYPVPAGFENDLLCRDFLNHCYRAGVPATLVQTALWWISEAAKRLNSQQDNAVSGNGQGRQPIRRQPTANDQAIFERDARRCETVLRNKWGHAYSSNLALVQEWLEKQPKEVQAHFSQPTTNAASGLNDPELILMLFTKATDTDIPKAASNIHKEIAAIEAVMKHERRRYLADENMQMRLRALYAARDRN